MKIVTAQEMRDIEARAQKEFGMSEEYLMENAGRSIANELLDNFYTEICGNKKILIICGSGGNGGDGLVAGRFLAEQGAYVCCYMVKRHKYKDVVQNNFDKAQTAKMHLAFITDLAELKERAAQAYLIVDCLLGIGLDKEVSPVYKEIINIINEADAKRISVDVPSGLNADTGAAMGAAVKADYTYAMGFVKKGCETGKEYCGALKPLSIGLPEDFI
ncbi:NAD(P)H-hydrate epimerase [Elusimicrobium simillimum]|uniref:NAD(P)H-hydrate epimerase n=1 Tax=Elusimicrobium simillimum TaxID=3143438 RepID=UPI003C705919